MPEWLWYASQLDGMIDWLNEKVPFFMQRKYLLIEWCNLVGVEFTREMAERIGVKEYS